MEPSLPLDTPDTRRHPHKEAEANEAAAYGAESIKVLKGLDAVRKRPGMYIGDTDDGSGLHHMVFEVVDNAVDEALAGFCRNIVITLLGDGAVEVEDDGRGIPTDLHASEGISAAEVIMTQLHAGGKFDQDAYKVSGGLHGVGVSVVNALSSALDLTVWRGGRKFRITFENGKSLGPLKDCGPNADPSDKAFDKAFDKNSGTKITFLPSAEIFSQRHFDFDTLCRRLREIAFLTEGLRIVCRDKRLAKAKEEVFEASVQQENKKTKKSPQSGLTAFLAWLDRTRTPLALPITMSGEVDSDIGKLEIACALQWNESYHETMFCSSCSSHAASSLYEESTASRSLIRTPWRASRCSCLGSFFAAMRSIHTRRALMPSVKKVPICGKSQHNRRCWCRACWGISSSLKRRRRRATLSVTLA